MHKTTAGDQIKQLLEFADGRDDYIEANIAQNPDHWCQMIALAVPYFALVRMKRYCMAQGVEDCFFCFIPTD